MTEDNPVTNLANSDATSNVSVAESIIANQWAFIVPLIVFLIIAAMYPRFEPPAFPDAAQTQIHYTNLSVRFVLLLAAQIVIAASLLFHFRKTYMRSFPFRVSPLSVGVGALGVVVWVGVCALGLEPKIFGAIGVDQFSETRTAFNPFEAIENSTLLWVFLSLRFAVLVLIVPVIEEIFLRGWLVRVVTDSDWWKVSLANIGRAGIIAAAVYGLLTHPSEAIAAVLWFSLVSWLMIRTGNLWDCVVAHAVTNLLLGVYVVMFSAWQLW